MIRYIFFSYHVEDQTIIPLLDKLDFLSKEKKEAYVVGLASMEPEKKQEIMHYLQDASKQYEASAMEVKINQKAIADLVIALDDEFTVLNNLVRRETSHQDADAAEDLLDTFK